MITTSHTISLLLFAFASTVTPGPNNIMVMASGAIYGWRRTLPHYLGICTGFPAMVLAVGLGLGSLFAEFPILRNTIKLLGVAYLLYLAWRIATTRTELQHEGEAPPARHRPLGWFEAVLFQWVNPKAWIMAIGALAVFSQAGSSVLQQALQVAASFLLAGFPCVGLWLFGGASLRRCLTTAGRQRTFNITMGILLAVSVLPMLAV